MYSNYSIIIDKGKRHADYVRHIFRDLLSWQKSSSNFFIERKKDDWDTETEVPAAELIQNSTDSYNSMVEAKEWTKKYPSMPTLFH